MQGRRHLLKAGIAGAALSAPAIVSAQTTFNWPTQLDLPGYRPNTRPHSKQVREAARMIVEAKRPVLYVGGGVIKSHASEELRRAWVPSASGKWIWMNWPGTNENGWPSARRNTMWRTAGAIMCAETSCRL